MGTALIYLVVVLGVAAVFFVGASAVFGRGEELAPIPPGATPTWLPEHHLRAVDVRDLRFQQALRGYKMAEVDWALERLAAELERVAADRERADVELERLAGERDALRRRLGELEPAGDAPDGGPADREADDVAATDTVTNGAAGTGAAAEEGTT
jgi:DivIVA domain-containing protein